MKPDHDVGFKRGSLDETMAELGRELSVPGVRLAIRFLQALLADLENKKEAPARRGPGRPRAVAEPLTHDQWIADLKKARKKAWKNMTPAQRLTWKNKMAEGKRRAQRAKTEHHEAAA